MNPGDPIIIERTANGWLVRPYGGIHNVTCIAEVHVFLAMDYDQLGVTSEATLWGFLAKHYAAKETS